MMNPWLIFCVWFALVALTLVFFVGVRVVESAWAQWEEDVIRRVAADNDADLPAEIDPERFDASVRLMENLPADWAEKEFLEVYAEIRRRKTGSA